MKFIALEDHTNICRHGELSRQRIGHFVFQYNYQFYCIVYCPCLERMDHIDFKFHTIMKKISSPGLPPGVCWRTNDLHLAIKNNDLDLLFKREVTEVCYVYGTGDRYAFLNKMPYKDHLALSMGYRERGYKARQDIEDNPIIKGIYKEHVGHALTSVIIYNKIEYDSLTNIQVMKLTDLLTKQNLKQLL